MCGHVGIAGDLDHKDEPTLKRLLMLDYFRGPDSTGFAAVRVNGDLKMAKIASHPLDLFDVGRFKEALSGHNSKVFLGHNRASTRGATNSVNAHPFIYGDIIGAHNGTLTASSQKALEEKLGETYNVDSQAIFACIDKFGIEETVPLLQGAWALVWYDAADGSLNFLRNKERTFWYAYDSKFKKLFWASEWPMIRSATDLSAHGYEIWQDEKGYGYFPTDPDVWYKHNLTQLRAGSTERPKPLAKVLKGKEPAPVVTNYGTGYTPFVGTTGTGNKGTTTTVSPPTNSTASGTTSRTGTSGTNLPVIASEPKVLTIMADNTNPFAGIISAQRFAELTQHGCSYCTQPVGYSDTGVVIFDRDDILICPKCMGNDMVPNPTNRIFLRSLEGIMPPPLSLVQQSKQ